MEITSISKFQSILMIKIDLWLDINLLYFITENLYGTGNGTMNDCLDPNRDCAAMLKLWLLVSVICYCSLNEVEIITTIAFLMKQSKQQ